MTTAALALDSSEAKAAAKLARLLSDQWWRICNLYWIQDEAGRPVRFEPNEAQEALWQELHHLNVILKARQLGFSTFVAIFILDSCVFRSGTAAGIIDYTLDDAKGKLGKIKFAYDRMDPDIKASVALIKSNAFELEWGNGSKVSVGTSHRGGTLQILHVSEFGKIAANAPEKAREIRTGAFGTVHRGSMIFVESTAEGAAGDYYEMVKVAQADADQGRKLTPQSFKLHFFPWWQHSGYVEDPDAVPISADLAAYFAKLEAEHKITLTSNQRAWYAERLRHVGPDDMLREYPSYADEAFHAAIQGAYFSTVMTRARQQGRIGQVPHDPGQPVHTCWDIGVDDETAVWFFQARGPRYHFLAYYENSGEGVDHYVAKLAELAAQRGWNYGRHLGPHDLDNKQWALPGASSALDMAGKLGLRFQVIPRVASKHSAIEAARTLIAQSWFDEAGCARGIACLDGYRKQWDDKRATYRSEPMHDWASHGADALMTGACGFVMPRDASASPAVRRPARLGMRA